MTDRTGHCDYHNGPSSTDLPVRELERQSGPCVVLRACAPCREQRHLEPLPSGEYDVPAPAQS